MTRIEKIVHEVVLPERRDEIGWYRMALVLATDEAWRREADAVLRWLLHTSLVVLSHRDVAAVIDVKLIADINSQPPILVVRNRK